MARLVDIRSALAKLLRAERQIDAFEREVADFVRDDFYRTETSADGGMLWWAEVSTRQIDELGLREITPVRQRDDGKFEVALLVNVFAVKAMILKPIPSIEWGTYVGDILNNLRGALDNFVWALTISEHDPPPSPIPPNRKGQFPWRTISFPILTDPDNWGGACGSNLRGINHHYRAQIKRLQPFESPQDPERHWLRRLDELWNSDKHRAVTVVEGFTGLRKINAAPMPGQILPPEEFTERFLMGMIEERPPGPFEHETEMIARFWTAPRELIGQTPARLKMEFTIDLGFKVAFDQGPPGYGNCVVETLRDFLTRIRAFIAQP